jgi:AcrR family transcriptional regulator
MKLTIIGRRLNLADKAVKSKQQVFHKDTFDKTTVERRQRVIDVAVSEFAARGYSATNINDIAKKAGISIGAMYSYFASKEDLFLAVVGSAYTLLETVLNDVRAKETDIFKLFEALLAASREYALRYPELNQIYLDLTTQGLSQMASRLSNKLESITVKTYRDVLREAKQKGQIAQNIDEETAAFFIDNIFMMYQFSFSVDYYKDRMQIFLGKEKSADTAAVEKSIMDFIKKALRQ